MVIKPLQLPKHVSRRRSHFKSSSTLQVIDCPLSAEAYLKYPRPAPSREAYLESQGVSQVVTLVRLSSRQGLLGSVLCATPLMASSNCNVLKLLNAQQRRRAFRIHQDRLGLSGSSRSSGLLPRTQDSRKSFNTVGYIWLLTVVNAPAIVETINASRIVKIFNVPRAPRSPQLCEDLQALVSAFADLRRRHCLTSSRPQHIRSSARHSTLPWVTYSPSLSCLMPEK